jgi:acyl dehydratase
VRTFASLAELAGAAGETLGPGQWHVLEQSRIDAFARATGDDQWIHVDPERAATGPFGGTVAHGYLTLSLIPYLMRELYRVDGVQMGVNYGLNRVRFPAPLRCGGRVRCAARVASVEPAPGGVQLVMTVTLEAEGAGKPCCVAETVTRLYGPVQ